jgi:hypothetical protein
MNAAAAGSECDLLFFVISGQTFAADPREVVRIDRARDDLPRATVRETAAARVLVARGGEGEFQLPVDQVLGVRRFQHAALRRPPALARAVGGPRAEEVMGLVLDGQSPVLIVDLQALSRRAEAPARREEG